MNDQSNSDDISNDGGKPGTGQGLHHSLPAVLSSDALSQPQRPGILRRRSSEPAVNARQTDSPTSRIWKKSPPSNQPAAAPAVEDSAPGRRDLYLRSSSSSSLHSAPSGEINLLEDGLHQVRWAEGTTSPLPSTSQQLSTCSTVSTTSSNSEKNNRPSAPPEEEDGFGTPVVKLSPKKKKKKIKNNSAMTTFSRRHRNVEPSQRMSQCDFLPIDPMFGDFAVPGSPSNHHINQSLPSSPFGGNPLGLLNDNDDERLWDSMPFLEHDSPNNNTERGGKEKKGTVEMGNGDNNTTNNNHLKKKEKSKKDKSKIKAMGKLLGEDASPKSTSSPSKKKKSVRRQSLPKVPNIIDPDEDPQQDSNSFLQQQEDRANTAVAMEHMGDETSPKPPLKKKKSTRRQTLPKIANIIDPDEDQQEDSVSFLQKQQQQDEHPGDEASPKSPNKKKQSTRRQTLPKDVPTTQDPEQKNLSEQLHKSMSFLKRKKKGRSKSMDHSAHSTPAFSPRKERVNLLNNLVDTNHSPTFTAATAPTTATSATTNSTLRRSSKSTAPPFKDDIFLIEMEKLRVKTASKLERAKLKKEKSARKNSTKSTGKKMRRSMSLQHVEFNIEDQSDHFNDHSTAGKEEDDHESVEEEDTSEHPSPQLDNKNNSQQPFEIEWNPPAFVTKLPRRASTGSNVTITSIDYEPITPTFVYDKARRRRASQVVEENGMPTFIMPPPFGTEDNSNNNSQDLDKSTANAVDAILNPRDYIVISTEEAIGMTSQSKNSAKVSKEKTKTRSPSMGHQSETIFSSSRRRPSMGHQSEKLSSSRRRPSMGHQAETLSRTRRGFSDRLDKSSKQQSTLSDPRNNAFRGKKTGRSAVKARRRGSTSVLEMSSSSVPREITSSSSARDSGKSRRREESMPPTIGSNRRSKSVKHHSRSRSKSPSPTMDTSATTRSKTKNSSSRNSSKRRGTSPSPTRHRDKLVKSKRPSSRRSSTSPPPGSRRSKSPKPRKEISKSRQQQLPPKLSSSGEKSGKRPKSGNKKSNSKRRSSMPTMAPPSAAAEAGKEKSRDKSRRQTAHNSMMSQSQSISSANPSKKKKMPRSRSIDHTGGKGSNLHTNETKSSKKKSSSKPPMPKKSSKRRASLGSIESGQSKLMSHITITPKQSNTSKGHSSLSALTYSTAHSESGYKKQYALPSQELKKRSSWSAEFEVDLK